MVTTEANCHILICPVGCSVYAPYPGDAGICIQSRHFRAQHIIAIIITPGEEGDVVGNGIPIGCVRCGNGIAQSHCDDVIRIY